LGASIREPVLDYFALDQKFVTFISEVEDIVPANSYSFDMVAWFEQRLPSDKVVVMDDYFESEIFFEQYKEEIVKQYEMVHVPDRDQLTNLIQDIESSESVAVHIREGDFVKQGSSNQIKSGFIVIHWSTLNCCSNLRTAHYQYRTKFGPWS
jgi:hypothetical protein